VAASGANCANEGNENDDVIAVAKVPESAINVPKGVKRYDPAPSGTGSSL
jgi:hypothetical protein